MKTTCLRNEKNRREWAFTLAEIMVTVAIFSLVIASTVTAHLYGMKLFEYIRPRLGASDDARRAVGGLRDEVRCASAIVVGSGTTNFVPIPRGSNQHGSALIITNADGSWIHYYCETNRLKRTTDGVDVAIVTKSEMTNAEPFIIQDYTGAILSNAPSLLVNHPVLEVNLEFSGSYTLRTKVVP